MLFNAHDFFLPFKSTASVALFSDFKSESGYFVQMVCISAILSEDTTDFIVLRGSTSTGSRSYIKYSDIKHIVVTLEFTIFLEYKD